MAQYQYTGVSRDGGVTSGQLAAASADEVAQLLRKQRIRVTKIEPVGQKRKLTLPFGIGNRAKVTQEEVAVFTRQFSVMIDAGLPLVQCLEILGSQNENRVFQKVLFEVRQQVAGEVGRLGTGSLHQQADEAPRPFRPGLFRQE